MASVGAPSGGGTERFQVLGEAVAGSGLGLLVGVLLGLSVTQLVGGVVAALSAVLAGFFGLSGMAGAGRSWRIGAFGFGCVLGVLAGLAIRSGALLAPSIASDVARWQLAGFPPEEARAYVLYERLGVKPAGITLAERPAPGAGSNVLFADKSGVCSQLQRLPEQAQLGVLKRAGDVYTALAATAEAASNPTQALAAGLAALCG
jgi:hypothetical protein